MSKIVPIGCVTSNNYKETGFVLLPEKYNSTTQTYESVKNIEECINRAKQFDASCSDNKCSYVVYNDSDISELLSEAASIYQKSLYESNFNKKIEYRNESLKLFKTIWLHFSPGDRKKQLNGNIPFMYGYNYNNWLKDNEYFKYFKDNENSKIVKIPPEKMKNTCWIGGNDVLKNNHIKLLDFKKQNNKIQCKHSLYMVPGTEGDDTPGKMKNYYQQIVDENTKKEKNAHTAAIKAKAMLSLMDNPINVDITTLFKNAADVGTKIELDAATSDLKTSINTTFDDLHKQEGFIKMINSLKNTSRDAINKNIELVKDKQGVSDKMESDLQTLFWSLEQSKNKEILQNKITTTLGIIIMLFAGLCIGMILYYSMKGGSVKINEIFKSKSEANALNLILGFKK
jgi:hypothetical protein